MRMSLLRRYAVCGSLASVLGSTTASALAASGADNDNALEEVTVSARKHEETTLDVPASITAFSAQTLEKLDIRSFNDYATKTPNLSFSYGTANWGYADSHTIAVRGVSGFGTTGVYIDDTPVPDSLDPRVVDIQRIEVLKGPQGTLFGQNSLGGNVRMITVEPSPTNNDAHYNLRAGYTSGAATPDYGLSFAGTQKLIGDNFLVRAVGFYDHTGGYVNRTYPDASGNLQKVDNYGANRAWGGSLAFRWIVSDSFEVSVRIMAQESQADGWLAPYAPNPPFKVESLTLDRTNDIQENARDRWYLPSLQLEYKGSGFQIHSSTSYFDRRETQIENGSEGTRDVFVADYGAGVEGDGAMPPNQPFAWSQVVSYRRTTHETRISFDKSSFGLSGVAGVYLSRSFSDTQLDSGDYPWIGALGLNTGGAYCPDGGTTCPTYGSSKAWFSYQPVYHHDEALFGELYYDFGNYELTLGARAYKQKQSGNELEYGALNFTYLNAQLPDTSQSGINPKAALSYKFTPETMAYVSYSKGFRSGGAGVPLPYLSGSADQNAAQDKFFAAIGQTPGTPTTFRSDTLDNFEIGAKSEFLNGRMVLTAAAYQMNWKDIQQTIIAPVSYITLTVNAGDARIRGGEIELQGRPTSYLDLRAGIGYSDAIITNGALYWQPSGSRVYQVPKETGVVSGTFTVPLGDKFTSFYTLSVNYTGNSVSARWGARRIRRLS